MKKLPQPSEKPRTNNEEVPMSIILPAFMAKKLLKLAAEKQRTVQEQLLFFIEQGVKHLGDERG